MKPLPKSWKKVALLKDADMLLGLIVSRFHDAKNVWFRSERDGDIEIFLPNVTSAEIEKVMADVRSSASKPAYDDKTA
jgi:hypothetical protein